jgi:hypothetical protein
MAEFRLRNIFKNNLFFFLFLIVICASYSCGGGGESQGTGSGTVSPPTDKTITLAWDPPTTDVNGNPITDSVGYILYYGPSPGIYDHSIDARNVTTYSVTLPPGTWYFSTTAYITPGFESDYSNEIQVNI